MRNISYSIFNLSGSIYLLDRALPRTRGAIHRHTSRAETVSLLRHDGLKGRLSSQVFLKSDDLCLMKGEHASPRLTLPSAHILAMHVQQLEIGAFTLTNGAYKWTKLR